MSASIVLSDRRRWDVRNWVLQQFFDDLRNAYPANGELLAYLDQLEPILYDDLRNDREAGWVARIYYDAAKRIVTRRVSSSSSSQLRDEYFAALTELAAMFEADGRFEDG